MTPTKPFDLAIAGELNLDLILYGLPLAMPTERDLLATGFAATLGSSSAIVAHNAAALGLRVQFHSLAGDDDFGRIAVERLRHMHVDVSRVRMDAAVTTGVTVLLPHGNVRHSFTYLGSIAQLARAHLDATALTQARHLHLCSLYLQQALHADICDLVRELKAYGLTVSLDTNDDPANAWGPPLHDLLPLVDIFMPNEDELCRMAGNVSLEQALQTFAQSVPVIVVKRGRHGCRVRHKSEIWDVPGLTVTPVDTIGAGDSFDAGFLAAYLQGYDLRTCARAGNITGALCTLGTGGTEAFRNPVLRDAFLKENGFPGA
ncbi:carbohydrate kinase family protein [Terriglobus sp.]|uniref:carbohydrate kinase family protein n=1 Tax=Terriglobus sp. TaxID=1889013 RepID=UPI003B008CAA